MKLLWLSYRWVKPWVPQCIKDKLFHGYLSLSMTIYLWNHLISFHLIYPSICPHTTGFTKHYLGRNQQCQRLGTPYRHLHRARCAHPGFWPPRWHHTVLVVPGYNQGTAGVNSRKRIHARWMAGIPGLFEAEEGWHLWQRGRLCRDSQRCSRCHAQSERQSTGGAETQRGSTRSVGKNHDRNINTLNKLNDCCAEIAASLFCDSLTIKSFTWIHMDWRWLKIQTPWLQAIQGIYKWPHHANCNRFVETW